MNGVEVLAVGEMGVGAAFNWPIGIIGGILLGVLMALYSAFQDDGDWPLGIIMGVGSAILFCVMLGNAYPNPTHTVPVYKVSISAETKMEEFLDKYEIIEQDGKIFTVKEKDNNDY